MKAQASELLSQVAEFKTQDHESAKSRRAALAVNRLREIIQPREKAMHHSSASARLSILPQRGTTVAARAVSAGLAAGKGINANDLGEEFQEF